MYVYASDLGQNFRSVEDARGAWNRVRLDASLYTCECGGNDCGSSPHCSRCRPCGHIAAAKAGWGLAKRPAAK